MQIFITVLILLLMLGILVSAHEAGHLVMAKSFNVYCLEYSLGFGPKLFSHKRKGGETAFSIRAFPLGGYVSMYTEGVDLPDGLNVPPERSLGGINPWKRILVLFAGIFVNLILSIVFVLIYATCIPSYTPSRYVYTGLNENAEVVATDRDSDQVVAYSLWIKGTIANYAVDESKERLYAPAAFTSSDNNTYFIVDPEAVLDGQHFVACYYPNGINDANLLDRMAFFYPKSAFEVTAVRSSLGLTSYPDVGRGVYNDFKNGSTLSLHLTTAFEDSASSRILHDQFVARSSHAVTSTFDGSSQKWGSNTLTAYTLQYYGSFQERMDDTAYYYTQYFVSIGAGLKSLFSFDFSQLGSVVAMGETINVVSQSIGVARTFFLYGGFLSLNLAIFNLLPFPGLDGWQILVTLIEHFARKKVPEKVKNVVSMVGLGLLFMFSIAIIVKDVVNII
jgi:membrane-associated protease RseP (regulator of RpoE activity)